MRRDVIGFLASRSVNNPAPFSLRPRPLVITVP
jgi:hypothetical protein